MPLILDTDHLTILLRRTRPEVDRLLSRLQEYAHDDVATTIVSFQEQIQGWMAFLNRARTGSQFVHAYAELKLLWRSFCKMNVISFDDPAQQWFARLRKQRLRLSTIDLPASLWPRILFCSAEICGTLSECLI